MLFANEELEPSVPVFPEPVKVQPEVEDEMSRRIKSTLGEYMQVKDLLIKDPKNLIGISMNNAVANPLGKNSDMSDVKTISDNKSELCSTVANSSNVQKEARDGECQDCDSEQSKHDEIENGLSFEKDLQKDDVIRNDNTKLATDGQNDVHSSEGVEFEKKETGDLPPINRRPSLKRQCKDKISIYDFEPFYGVWTKKTKVCSRSRYPRNQGKDQNMGGDSAECDQKHCDGNSDFTRSEEMSNQKMFDSEDDTLPTLNMYPDIPSKIRKMELKKVHEDLKLTEISCVRDLTCCCQADEKGIVAPFVGEEESSQETCPPHQFLQCSSDSWGIQLEHTVLSITDNTVQCDNLWHVNHSRDGNNYEPCPPPHLDAVSSADSTPKHEDSSTDTEECYMSPFSEVMPESSLQSGKEIYRHESTSNIEKKADTIHNDSSDDATQAEVHSKTQKKKQVRKKQRSKVQDLPKKSSSRESYLSSLQLGSSKNSSKRSPPFLKDSVTRSSNFSTNGKVGSCHIQNGIIKIRLSKCPSDGEKKKDSYSTISCVNVGDDPDMARYKADAIIGCKTLSVPLSPIRPAMYNVLYCSGDVAHKNKKRTHSTNKSRHQSKQRGQATRDKTSKKSSQGTECEIKDVPSLSLELQEPLCEQLHVDNENSQEAPKLVCVNEEMCQIENGRHTDGTMGVNVDKTEESDRCSVLSRNISLMSDSSNNLTPLCKDIGHNSLSPVKEVNGVPTEMVNISEINSPLLLSEPPVLSSPASSCSVATPDENPILKVMCSIDLSFLTRIPSSIPLPIELESDYVSSLSSVNKIVHIQGNDVGSPSDATEIGQENLSVCEKYEVDVVCDAKSIKKEAEMILSPAESDILHKVSGIDMRPHGQGEYNFSPPSSFPLFPLPVPHLNAFHKNTCNTSSSVIRSTGVSLETNKDNLFSELKDTPNIVLSSDKFRDHPPLEISPNSEAPCDDSTDHPKKLKTEIPEKFLHSSIQDEKWNEHMKYKWYLDYSEACCNSEDSIAKSKIPAYSVTNSKDWVDIENKKQYSSDYYLNEAKKLKHQADRETDRMVQAMKYLEAVLYFILTGNAMEHSYIDTDRVHTMYKETLTLIRYISSKFQKLHNSSCRNIDNKLTVLSLRCQSLLYLKMYQLRRDEVRHLHKTISSFLKSENGSASSQASPLQLRPTSRLSQVSPCSHTSPCSLTPSPAGSIASVGSQSSGYSSSELSWAPTTMSVCPGAQLPFEVFHDLVTVSRSMYQMMQQQSNHLANLHLCHDLWEHADYLSSKEHSREFFMELDEECGSLSLHSPFSALVYYVRKGLYKLKDGT